MSWIRETAVSEAEGKLAETYAALIEQRGKVSNILQV
ncbi:MAG: peroxidase, partial [Woeseiaceae bacterium]|nr:peroxidase [Woeseiaceae bacterium]